MSIAAEPRRMLTTRVRLRTGAPPESPAPGEQALYHHQEDAEGHERVAHVVEPVDGAVSESPRELADERNARGDARDQGRQDDERPELVHAGLARRGAPPPFRSLPPEAGC